jgi:hypothetical protein
MDGVLQANSMDAWLKSPQTRAVRETPPFKIEKILILVSLLYQNINFNSYALIFLLKLPHSWEKKNNLSVCLLNIQEFIQKKLETQMGFFFFLEKREDNKWVGWHDNRVATATYMPGQTWIVCLPNS